MKKMHNMFNSAVAVIATALTFLFGDADDVLIILCVFMALDYLTGIGSAIVHKELSSEIGAKGIWKKAMIFVVVAIAVQLDKITGNANMFKTLVCYFYIANEGISLLENASELGVPVPAKIRKALEQLNEDEEEMVESE